MHIQFKAFLEKRLKEQQPVSSGFIAIRDNYDGITRAAAFLWKVLGVYTSKYMSASRMLGHQLALAWVVASEPSFDAKRYARPERFMHDIADASVLFLPSTVYNWIPPEGAGRGPVPWHAPGCQGGALQRFKETLDA